MLDVFDSHQTSVDFYKFCIACAQLLFVLYCGCKIDRAKNFRR